MSEPHVEIKKSQVNPAVVRHIQETVRKLVEPMGLDRWTIGLGVGEITEDDCTAGCSADPEYRKFVIAFDFDRMDTGEDLDETIVHEMGHPHQWPMHALLERYAHLIADMMPEYAREGMRTSLLEEVRHTAERVATDVGHTNLRLLRRAGILVTPNPEPADAAVAFQH